MVAPDHWHPSRETSKYREWPTTVPTTPEREIHVEMVRYLGAFLERDPRWRGYWHSSRLDRYHELPHMDAGDVQMLAEIVPTMRPVRRDT